MNFLGISLFSQDCRNIQKQFKRRYKLSIDSNASLPNGRLSNIEHLAEGVRNDGTSLGNIEAPVSPASAYDGSKPQSDYEKWELSDDESGEVHISTKNKKPNVKNSLAEEMISWKQWFKVPAFYLYGFVYMFVRLLVNVQSVKNYKQLPPYIIF